MRASSINTPQENIRFHCHHDLPPPKNITENVQQLTNRKLDKDKIKKAFFATK